MLSVELLVPFLNLTFEGWDTHHSNEPFCSRARFFQAVLACNEVQLANEPAFTSVRLPYQNSRLEAVGLNDKKE